MFKLVEVVKLADAGWTSWEVRVCGWLADGDKVRAGGQRWRPRGNRECECVNGECFVAEEVWMSSAAQEQRECDRLRAESSVAVDTQDGTRHEQFKSAHNARTV